MISLSILDILKAMVKTTQPSIQVWIAEWLSKQQLPVPISASLMLGDGSSRIFYRVLAGEKKFILICDPQWTQTQDYPAHQQFLQGLHLPVPEFYIIDSAQGFLLMEDLGDELLQQRILTQPNTKMAWLKKAAVLLADLHGKTFPVPAQLPAAQRRFDAEKYGSEIQFTFEQLHQKLLNLAPPNAEQSKALKSFSQKIAALEPAVFSHRDYHTRNLMIREEKLVMIDFQDARLGSPHYDLASLLYDAYLSLTEEERSDLLKTYRDQLAQYAVSKQGNVSQFETDLKEVAFQRTLKAAGSFVSFFLRYGKLTHWPYLIPALQSALELQKEGRGVDDSVIPIQNWITQISNMKIE